MTKLTLAQIRKAGAKRGLFTIKEIAEHLKYSRGAIYEALSAQSEKSHLFKRLQEFVKE